VSARAAIAATCALVLGAACHRDGAGRLEAVRDALVHGDVARARDASAASECRDDPDARACLASLATAMGGRGGFSTSAPDDASLAAVGVWMLRTHHGETVPAADVWLAGMAGGVGPGADVLRLAVAAAMAEEARVVRKEVHGEAGGHAFAAAVARAVPGERGARSEGEGWTVAFAGAAEVWVTTSRALDLGQDRMTGDARVALGQRMGVVRVATGEIEARGWEQRGGSGRDAGRP
jgi:hypothetical protein